MDGCNICLSNNLEIKKSCNNMLCDFRACGACLRIWYKNIIPGDIIHLSRLLCPSCKSVGLNEYLQLDKLDALINTIRSNPGFVYCLCMICKKFRKDRITCQDEFVSHRFFCEKCQSQGFKECPNCGIMINKIGGCNHINCPCGVHLCWICLEIHNVSEIYNHISRNHSSHIEQELGDRERYIMMLGQHQINLRDIPDNERTEDICIFAVEQNFNNIAYVPEQILTYDICLETVKRAATAIKYIPTKYITSELALISVQQNPTALHYIPQTINNYLEICLEAIKQKEQMILIVDTEDIGFIKKAIEVNPGVKKYLQLCR